MNDYGNLVFRLSLSKIVFIFPTIYGTSVTLGNHTFNLFLHTYYLIYVSINMLVVKYQPFTFYYNEKDIFQN